MGKLLYFILIKTLDVVGFKAYFNSSILFALSGYKLSIICNQSNDDVKLKLVLIHNSPCE